MKAIKGKNKSSRFAERWFNEDYPGGSKRFQIELLMKDLGIFILLPLGAIILTKLLSSPGTPSASKRPERKLLQAVGNEQPASQIIRFHGEAKRSHSVAVARKRAPGSLVRVRLLNTVETLSAGPVHAQIIDSGLGTEFLGGTLIGEATADAVTGRITVAFNFARYPNRTDIAEGITARALSLDGTAGIEARKKEGYFARGSLAAASATNANLNGGDNQDFRTLVARAVASGLMQEFKNDATVASNRAQVLTLKPMTEFFVELTDYFPSNR